MYTKQIILASKSPRRKQLLEEAGFSIIVKVNEADESYPEELPLENVAEFIAKKKANANKIHIEVNTVLLTSDTVVIHNNKIFEKPKSREEAFEMLKAMSNQTHKVVSGVCLQNLEKQISFSGTATVTFDPLSDEEIAYYLDNYKPYDKAGAYGIQEWIGHCKIKSISGNYTTIMGLPVQLVYQNLMEYF